MATKFVLEQDFGAPFPMLLLAFLCGFVAPGTHFASVHIPMYTIS